MSRARWGSWGERLFARYDLIQLLTYSAEMKYIIAALYSNHSTTIVDDAGIEQIDAYTAPPASHELLIRLEKPTA
jgi:hypothetical protein